MVSVKDVAAAAAVSIGTVSNVLNRPDLVSEATRDRVMQAIEELGYVRNDAARQLRAGSSRSIGLIMPSMLNPFYASVARGASERAEREGLSLIVALTERDLAREDRYLSLFEEQRVAGVLVMPAGDSIETLQRLTARGFGAVLIDHEAPGSGIPSVSVDDVEGGRMAVQHLLDRGRRRILVAGGTTEMPPVRDRLEGAAAAVAGTPGATLEHFPTGEPNYAAGREIAKLLVGRGPADIPDAVFAINDLIGLGLERSLALYEGFEVPQRIAMVGYDDIEFSRDAVPPLTSVRQPAELLGEAAVELLLDPDLPREAVFTPELVVRESS